MKKKRIIRNLNYQPHQLQDHQLSDPLKVMTYFFADFPIHESRDRLRELYEGWVYHSSGYATGQTVKDMLDFYVQFREFLEACYVCTESINPNERG